MPQNKWNAIVAMSENRVIGKDNRLPWTLPADMKWFGDRTNGQVLALGRETFESMRLRPQNAYLVLTRDKTYTHPAPNVEVIHDLEQIPSADRFGRAVWICGGAELYQATLAQCQYLYVTTVKGVYAGDAFFPVFEDSFRLLETLREDAQMRISCYENLYLTEKDKRV